MKRMHCVSWNYVGMIRSSVNSFIDVLSTGWPTKWCLVESVNKIFDINEVMVSVICVRAVVYGDGMYVSCADNKIKLLGVFPLVCRGWQASEDLLCRRNGEQPFFFVRKQEVLWKRMVGVMLVLMRGVPLLQHCSQTQLFADGTVLEKSRGCGARVQRISKKTSRRTAVELGVVRALSAMNLA
jgi:hypothetical protein